MSKTYIFEVELKSKGRGTVIADSKEEAKEKILDGEYEDIYDEYDSEIVSVKSIKES